jgi:hypothetical protein
LSPRALCACLLLLAAAACDRDSLSGVRPRLVPPVDTQDFGPVPLLNEKQLELVLSNVGRAPLQVTSAAVQEPGVPFRVVSVPGELSAGTSAQVVVSFRPTAEESYAATLVLQTDDPDYPSVNVRLLGQGSTRAKMELVPEALDFGTVAEGTSSVKTLTVRSTGTADLLLEDIAMVDGTPSAFAFVGSTKTPATVKAVAETGLPGEIQLTVKFTAEPGAPATLGGALRLRGTDPDRTEVLVPLTAAINRAPIAVIAPVGNAAPGMVVQLDGTGSNDPDGNTPLTYKWTLRQKPLGSTTVITPTDAATASMTLDATLPGQYEVQLEVTDALGAKSLVPARLSVVASPAQKLLVELFWDNAVTDLDLHVTNAPTAALGGVEDCHYANKSPDWGLPGDATDDPDYLRDALTGYGPEVFGYVNPVDATYRVHVVLASAHLQPQPTSRATVRVYQFGILKGEFKKTLTVEGETWPVVDVTWPAGTLTPVPEAAP